MRTDMALELREKVGQIDGVEEQSEWSGGIAVSRIRVRTQEAARKLDKPIGNYITLRLPDGALADQEAADRVAAVLSSEISRLLPHQDGASALVVGLGNRYVTPDALGPRVSEHVYVTRHVLKFLPDVIPKDTRPVSACAPNVLGVTGIETVEVVTGLVRQIRPDFVLAVDCLCASDSRNVGVSIQMNDSGISPGAGIGNFQTQLNEETLNVPVLAVGMPLVISRATIVREAFSALKMEMPSDAADALSNDLIVTPKDIDAIVRDASRLLSDAVNAALFGKKLPEIRALLQ